MANNYGFTRDPNVGGLSVMTPYYNKVTGAVYNAPDSAYNPPNADWVAGEKPAGFGLGRGSTDPATNPVTSSPVGGADTTTIDPSQSTLSPNFSSYVYDMLGKGQGLASLPYQEFTGQRFAGPSQLQSQAFTGLGSLQTPSYFQQGAGMLGGAGGSFADPGTAQTFMSPYMQNVVDINKREAQRQADIAGTQRGAKFAQSGAFGGARQAIENAEADRNLQMQFGDIQSKGLQSAFDQAQKQYNAEQESRMRAGYNLSSLGLQGLKEQLGAGATQQQLEQQPFDFGYQQFQESMKYPYQQATFQQSLLQGLPLQARGFDEGQGILGSLMQGGLSGLALYNLLNKP